MSTRWASAARVSLAAAVLAAAVLAGGGPAAAADRGATNIDLVVLVDTSESMFPYFDDLMTYLVQDLLTQRLHRGDTFHLLSFSSLPEVEIAQAVTSDESARQAFGRVLLLHALGKYTDLVAALQFLYQYVKELPETNPKHLIIITDGVHDPPPGSPYQSDPATVKGLVVSSAQAMRREGWEVTILRVPPEPSAADRGATSYLGDLAAAIGVPVIPYPRQDKTSVTGVATGYPTLVFPPALGQIGNSFTAPFRIRNWKAEPIIISLASVQSEGAELLERKVSVTVPAGGEAAFNLPLKLPISYPKGVHDAPVQLVFDDDPRISPTAGTLSFTYTGKGGLPIPRLTFLYVVYIVLGLAALFLLVMLFRYLRRKLGEVPLEGIARAHGALAEADDPAPPEQAAGRAGARAGARLKAPRAAASAPLSDVSALRPAGKSSRVSLMDAGTVSSRKGSRRQIPLLAPGTAARSERQAMPKTPQPAARQASKPPAKPAAAAGRAVARPTVSSIRQALPRPIARGDSLPPLIEMRVQRQNHRVGFRNVHRIPPGGAKSVGGRFSAFLVFLVPVPGKIAEIRSVDGRYVFTPLRPELFPGLSGPVEDCLGKEIPFVSAAGKEQVLHFREWVSPLEEINRVLRQSTSGER